MTKPDDVALDAREIISTFLECYEGKDDSRNLHGEPEQSTRAQENEIAAAKWLDGSTRAYEAHTRPEPVAEIAELADALYWYDIRDDVNTIASVIRKARKLVTAIASPAKASEEAEPVAWWVHDFHITRQPVKARGKFPEVTEYLYPAFREQDAKSVARTLGGECTPLYAALRGTGEASSAERELEELRRDRDKWKTYADVLDEARKASEASKRRMEEALRAGEEATAHSNAMAEAYPSGPYPRHLAEKAVQLLDRAHELRRAALSDSPASAAPAVTDAMVVAAAAVLLGHVNAPEQAIYQAARLALEAALLSAAPAQQEEPGR